MAMPRFDERKTIISQEIDAIGKFSSVAEVSYYARATIRNIENLSMKSLIKRNGRRKG